MPFEKRRRKRRRKLTRVNLKHISIFSFFHFWAMAWACPACTFNNVTERTLCEMCATAKDIPSAKQAPPPKKLSKMETLAALEGRLQKTEVRFTNLMHDYMPCDETGPSDKGACCNSLVAPLVHLQFSTRRWRNDATLACQTSQYPPGAGANGVVQEDFRTQARDTLCFSFLILSDLSHAIS